MALPADDTGREAGPEGTARPETEVFYEKKKSACDDACGSDGTAGRGMRG